MQQKFKSAKFFLASLFASFNPLLSGGRVATAILSEGVD